MKKIYTLIAAALLATGAAAQNPTAYFMEGSTFRSQFNPAFAPLRGYVNIPVLGGVQVNMAGNIALDNIFYPRDGKLVTLLDSSVSAAEVLGNLKTDNLLGADFRMNVIGFGAFTKNHKNFWSFDLNVRVNEDANLPYSLFEFIKLGKEGQIRNFGTSMDAYLEAAFSYSFPLMNDRLYVGDNIHPFFMGHELEDGTPLPYGRELYPAESFFRTDQKVYSRTALSYRRSFFDDTVSVRAEFAAHHDGTALGTQQMLVVGVKLLKTVYNSKNHKK